MRDFVFGVPAQKQYNLSVCVCVCDEAQIFARTHHKKTWNSCVRLRAQNRRNENNRLLINHLALAVQHAGAQNTHTHTHKTTHKQTERIRQHIRNNAKNGIIDARTRGFEEMCARKEDDDASSPLLRCVARAI